LTVRVRGARRALPRPRHEVGVFLTSSVDGSGRIGPSLIGAERIHERTATDVGLFEAVFGGSLGAMQSFRDRLTQDEILRIDAYVRSLRRDGL
jgi:mono/diheme cytochrome c family protein